MLLLTNFVAVAAVFMQVVVVLVLMLMTMMMIMTTVLAMMVIMTMLTMVHDGHGNDADDPEDADFLPATPCFALLPRCRWGYWWRSSERRRWRDGRARLCRHAEPAGSQLSSTLPERL